MDISKSIIEGMEKRLEEIAKKIVSTKEKQDENEKKISKETEHIKSIKEKREEKEELLISLAGSTEDFKAFMNSQRIKNGSGKSLS
jgi:chromosome segregation ATPase